MILTMLSAASLAPSLPRSLASPAFQKPFAPAVCAAPLPPSPPGSRSPAPCHTRHTRRRRACSSACTLDTTTPRLLSPPCLHLAAAGAAVVAAAHATGHLLHHRALHPVICVHPESQSAAAPELRARGRARARGRRPSPAPSNARRRRVGAQLSHAAACCRRCSLASHAAPALQPPPLPHLAAPPLRPCAGCLHRIGSCCYQWHRYPTRAVLARAALSGPCLLRS